jgi:thiol-disulfide isomerase/thioredoxin
MPKKCKIPSPLNPWFIFGIIVVITGGLVYLSVKNKKENFTSSPNTFDSDVADGQKLVWFYADWCGHCKNMHTDWDSAASQMNGDNVKMVKVDCGDPKNKSHEKITRKYNISGYPTIMLLENGEPVGEYKDGRGEQDFISYVNQNIQ